MSKIDAQAIKQQHRKDWDRAATSWRKYDESLRQSSAPLTRRMLELADIQPGHRVLDIASGTGEPGLPAAEIVGPSGSVLLTDQSPEMLAVAREKARAEGLQNVDFLVCDAEQLELEPASFDAALCRGALPLMPDPPAVLRIAYAALKPGGRIALTAGGRPEANPYFTVPYLVLRKYRPCPDTSEALPGHSTSPTRTVSTLPSPTPAFASCISNRWSSCRWSSKTAAHTGSTAGSSRGWRLCLRRSPPISTKR